MRRFRTVLICCALLLSPAWLALRPALAQAQSADDAIVLVDETFDNPDAGEFPAFEDERTRHEYERGVYVMEGFGQQFDGLMNENLLDMVVDGTIAVDVRLRGATDGRMLYVGCRADGRGRIGYQLMLDPANGRVILFVDTGTEFLPLTDFVFHDAIRTGNRTNRLELRCVDSTISGFVNGVEVVSLTDDTQHQGVFYFGAGNPFETTGPVEGVFDNLLVTILPSPNRSAQQDAREFDQLRAEAQERTSLFGPAAGEIRVTDEAFVGDRFAGVDARDVYAKVTFVNPHATDERRWDAGLAFRYTGQDNEFRLILRSTGRWYLSEGYDQPSASGIAQGMATAEGDENTIELAVIDETGYLALNGEYLATLDVSARMTSGDVWVGSSFFEGDNVPGDRTAFHDFEVWELGDDAAQAEPADGQSGLPSPRDPDKPAEEPTAAETVTVELHDMDQSGRSGQATLTAEGDQTKVALRVRDVPGDTLVVLQDGPCTALNEESGFELRSLNDAGVSVTRIDSELDALLAESHAIVVYDYDAEVGIATLPVVCGEIAG